MLTITVLVPTYRRPKDLARCLNALIQQERPADEVLLIVRDTDRETWQFLDEFDFSALPLNMLKISSPGQVAALNLGLETAIGSIIAITDDDAAPHSDWLERIEQHFIHDPLIGAVGGRDWVYYDDQLVDGSKLTVGKIQWFGRVIGNHCFGVGEAREVDILKGANMSYRRSAIQSIQFDTRLRGEGAQVYNDLLFSQTVKRLGWKLIYDPAVSVDHFPAKRFDDDSRHQFNPIAQANKAHNETLSLLESLPGVRRYVFLIWATFVGNPSCIGVLQLFRHSPKRSLHLLSVLRATFSGRLAGYQIWCQDCAKSKLKQAHCQPLDLPLNQAK
jgi:glycosyltransferase involved in cell wall biosynthesis